jgi:hypothetical protein
MMHWYNPKTRLNEEVPAPMSDAQAIELLSPRRVCRNQRLESSTRALRLVSH